MSDATANSPQHKQVMGTIATLQDDDDKLNLINQLKAFKILCVQKHMIVMKLSK